MKNKVLIVEDEISIAKMIGMNLNVAGYDTVMFHDGREAAGVWTMSERRGR